MQVSLEFGVLLSVCWSLLVALSRIYVGMHSFLVSAIFFCFLDTFKFLTLKNILNHHHIIVSGILFFMSVQFSLEIQLKLKVEYNKYRTNSIHIAVLFIYF